eukprot:4001363-Heterocapsa_arctica.AAC.1
MVARFGTLLRCSTVNRHGCVLRYASEELRLPGISTVKRLGCALQTASKELNCQAAWLRASVLFRGAQLSSGMAARF